MRVASRGLKAALRASPRRPAWSAARPPPLAAAAGESAPRAAAAPPSSAAGAFSKLPVVPAADDHLASAVRRAGRVRADPKIKNDAARARHAAARRLDALAQALCTPVGAMTRAFPAVDALHPFDAALLTLTLGDGRYEKTLARVDAGRRAALQAGKDAAAAAAKARTKADAVAAQADGEAAVRAAWARGGGPALDALKEVAKALRRLPAVDAAAPVAALVGAPNVGKSSIVRALSSGVPEVNSYPFTTRSVAVGHFYVDGVKHQVRERERKREERERERRESERRERERESERANGGRCGLLPCVIVFIIDRPPLSPPLFSFFLSDHRHARPPGPPRPRPQRHGAPHPGHGGPPAGRRPLCRRRGRRVGLVPGRPVERAGRPAGGGGAGRALD